MENPAQVIGALVQRARASHIESVTYLIEAGVKLRAQKAALPHGDWLLWVKEHEEALGFNARTAQLLMHAARDSNAKSTAYLTDDEAARLSRAIWGNEPEVTAIPGGAPLAYFSRFLQWTGKHSVGEFVGLPEADRLELLAHLESAVRWISQLQQAIDSRRAA